MQLILIRHKRGKAFALEARLELRVDERRSFTEKGLIDYEIEGHSLRELELGLRIDCADISDLIMLEYALRRRLGHVVHYNAELTLFGEQKVISWDNDEPADAQPPAPPVDLSGYVTKTDFNELASRVSYVAGRLSVVVFGILIILVVLLFLVLAVRFQWF